MRALDRLQVASPCKADWDEMEGDDRARFCGACRLHVYDLSALPSDEAERLVREREGGRLCVRFFRRADGTVLTRDCPVGLRAVRRRVALLVAGLVAGVAFTLFGVARARETDGSWFAGTEPFRTLSRLLPPAIRPAPPPPSIMGRVAFTPPRAPAVAPPEGE